MPSSKIKESLTSDLDDEDYDNKDEPSGEMSCRSDRSSSSSKQYRHDDKPSAVVEGLLSPAPTHPHVIKKKNNTADYYFSLTIPAGFLCAAAICWHDHMKFPFLFFVFIAIGFIRSDALLHASKRLAVRHISDGITLSFALFAKDEQQSKAFMQALSETIRVALTNEQLTTTFKEIAIDTMRDEQLQSGILDTLSAAIVRAMQDENFKTVVLSAVQQGFSDALSNKVFMDSMFDAIVEAIITASENKKLRKAVLDVSTEAVSTAVRDERFMNELKQVVKECLRDSELFRAGATGFIGAMMPGGGRK